MCAQECLPPLVKRVPPSLATPEGIAAQRRYIYSGVISVAISESLRWLALSSEYCNTRVQTNDAPAVKAKNMGTGSHRLFKDQESQKTDAPTPSTPN